MCISSKYIFILSRLNQRDFAEGRASRETYDRFTALFERCRSCQRCNNGVHGDALPDCRQAFLRLFISMKNDAEIYLTRGPIPDTPSVPIEKLDAEMEDELEGEDVGGGDDAEDEADAADSAQEEAAPAEDSSVAPLDEDPADFEACAAFVEKSVESAASPERT